MHEEKPSKQNSNKHTLRNFIMLIFAILVVTNIGLYGYYSYSNNKRVKDFSFSIFFPIDWGTAIKHIKDECKPVYTFSSSDRKSYITTLFTINNVKYDKNEPPSMLLVNKNNDDKAEPLDSTVPKCVVVFMFNPGTRGKILYETDTGKINVYTISEDPRK